jgi:CRP-like cAMP-binding protein
MTCEVEVPSGRVLVQQGKPADQVLIITVGRGRATRGETRLGTYEPGACLGAREVVEHVPAPVTVTAETPVRVRAATVRAFRSLLDIPAIAHLATVRPILQDASGPRTLTPYGSRELAAALLH